MTVRHTTWGLVLCIAFAACGGTTARQAATTPTPLATAVSPVGTPSSLESPTASASWVPSSQPSSLPLPSLSLVCSGSYKAGHPLVVGAVFSLAGYSSLDVLDVTDPLAPTLVCTVNNAPYPIQPIQWLSQSEFALVAIDQPSRMLRVDVSGRSITTLRQLNDYTAVTALSPDRTWLATMEGDPSGASFARLYGPSSTRTLASYPIPGGHGGTIYGFGGPKVGFSPDGSLVLSVDYQANQNDATVPNLQVFDLQGNRVFWSARGTWAVWAVAALYYDGGDGKVYRWVFGGQPVEVMRNYWIEPGVSPDGQSIAFLSRTLAASGPTFNLQKLDTRSGVVSTVAATDLRIYPLFVTSTMMWVSELGTCDNCYGGYTVTGKVFAYDLATRGVREVRLPELLSPLAGASLSPAA